jgi:uncharacterized Tic20 family protein
MTEPDDREPSPEQPRDEASTPLTPPGQPPYGSPPPPGQPYGGPPPGQPYGGPPPGQPYGGPPYGGPPPQYGPGPYPPPYGQQGITAPDDATWALAAYVGQLIIGFVAPLIVFLVRKDQSPFVRFHGAQALNAALSYLAVAVGGITVLFVSAAANAPAGLIIAFPVLFIFAIVHFVYLIIAAVKAGRREMYRLPAWICWRMVK